MSGKLEREKIMLCKNVTAAILEDEVMQGLSENVIDGDIADLKQSILQENVDGMTIFKAAAEAAAAKSWVDNPQSMAALEEIRKSDTPTTEFRPVSSAEPSVGDRGQLSSEDDDDERYEHGLRIYDHATAYMRKENFDLATNIYMNVAQFAMGFDRLFSEISVHGVESPSYRALSEKCRYLVMLCFQGLATCALGQVGTQGLSNILAWLYESEILVKNRRYGDFGIKPCYDWRQFTDDMLPLYTVSKHIDCLICKADVFHMLGNGAAYQHMLTMAAHFLVALPSREDTGDIDIQDRLQLTASWAQLEQHQDGLISRHHPDPDSDERYRIVDANLQVRGAWKKIPITIEDIPPTQSHRSAFIWGGYLYVATMKQPENVGSHVKPHELRRLNLKRHDKWEFVTKFPTVRGKGGLNRLCVDDNKMYAYAGHPILDILDLSTNKWTATKTTWKPTMADRRAGVDPVWPWPKKSFLNAALEIVDGRLYVFGGVNGASLSGCNLFMELDLKTLKWRRLSGMESIPEHYDPRTPGPRTSPGFWASKDKKHLYLFSGDCNKSRNLAGDQHGPTKSWVYDDVWSWDIDAEVWREEKMLGNPPSPRAWMGCVFSEKLNKAIIFGGINQTCQTVIGESSDLRKYSIFYGDTFMWNPSDSGSTSGYWQQIQTVGFPTYRGSPQLVIDPDAGDIYLYGGEVLGDTIPSKNRTEIQRRKRWKHENVIGEAMGSRPELAARVQAFGIEDVGIKTYTQYFGDLWKLHIDIPGGGFECINMEDEMRTAPLGPWQRCFECRKAGFWKKCGGTCGGKAFFCGTDCQTRGWKGHKRLNECRKL